MSGRKDVWAKFRVSVKVRLDLAPTLHRAAVIEAIEGLLELREREARRGPAALPRPAVWTMHDLSVYMEQREYKVRAAVGWLVHQGRAVNVGQLEQVNRLTGRRYSVSVYELLDEKKPTDWVGISRAFRSRG
jgi:hypothetical protein